MKKYIAPLGLVALLLTGCGSSPAEREKERDAAVASIMADDPSETPVAPVAQPTPVQTAPPKPAPTTEAPLEVVPVDAAQLLLDYDQNEAAADMKYAGKMLEVTGHVSKVDTEFFNDEQYSVQLDDGSEYGFLSVSCNDVPADQAALVVPEGTVTVRGVFDDGGDLGVELKECAVL